MAYQRTASEGEALGDKELTKVAGSLDAFMESTYRLRLATSEMYDLVAQEKYSSAAAEKSLENGHREAADTARDTEGRVRNKILEKKDAARELLQGCMENRQVAEKNFALVLDGVQEIAAYLDALDERLPRPTPEKGKRRKEDGRERKEKHSNEKKRRKKD